MTFSCLASLTEGWHLHSRVFFFFFLRNRVRVLNQQMLPALVSLGVAAWQGRHLSLKKIKENKNALFDHLYEFLAINV